jgi:biotin operon repressor
MPRKDLHVTVNGTEIKPALALGAWAAFHRVPKGAMIMGDLVLTEDEVGPVMKTLQEGGVQVTALHNHLLGESPKIMYVHMGGVGDPVKMAATVKAAVALTKTPPPGGSPAPEPEKLDFDTEAVAKIIGQPGKVSGGVLHIGVPRKISEDGMELPPSLGAGTSINFQPTGNGRAAIAGDFALTGDEVETVIQTLRANGIETMALHSHALNDQPRIFYLHFWANDDATKLARGLRAALDHTKSGKQAAAK